MSNGGPMHGIFCWNELCTTDTDKAGQFFTKLLGWTSEVSNITGMEYTQFKIDQTYAAGMVKKQKEWGDTPPHWMAYIAVSDVDAVSGKVEELGGKLLHPPCDIPGVGRFSMISDPTGAVVGLITLKTQEKK